MMTSDECVELHDKRVQRYKEFLKLKSEISDIDKQLSEHYDDSIRDIIRRYGVETDDYIEIKMPGDGYPILNHQTSGGFPCILMIISVKLPKPHLKHGKRGWSVTPDTILEDYYEQLTHGRGWDHYDYYFSESRTIEEKRVFLEWLTKYTNKHLNRDCL